MADNFCVPDCLEFILAKRGFHTSKDEIAKELKIKNDGIDINGVILDCFLKKYRLKCIHHSPFATLETDLLLKDELTPDNDILVAYNYAKLFSSENLLRHMSIVLKYDPLKDLIYLFNPPEKTFNIKLIDLNNAIQLEEDERFGFYVVKKI